MCEATSFVRILPHFLWQLPDPSTVFSTGLHSVTVAAPFRFHPQPIRYKPSWEYQFRSPFPLPYGNVLKLLYCPRLFPGNPHNTSSNLVAPS
jgi:hypothetical protein